MAYSEKDLFLVLTVVCLLVVIYLIASIWRSAGKKPQEPVKPNKRVERIHRPKPTAENPALPKVPRRPEPVKETPRLPNAIILMNEEGSAIATARAITSDLVIEHRSEKPYLDEASLQVLGQYFPMSDQEGFCAHRLIDSGNFQAQSMTVFDQKGDVLIQTIPIDLPVDTWPTLGHYDLDKSLLREVESLYRREFLDRLAWRAQFFCLRFEQLTIEELLQVPLQSTLQRSLTLLLCVRILQTSDYWTKCRLFNRVEDALDEISFKNQFDYTNLKQRIKSHLFAISQTKLSTPCFFKNRSIRSLSL